MKKALSLLLCLCMLASVVSLFASCGGGKATVDLTQYKVVYAADLGGAYSSPIEQFVDRINRVLNAGLRVRADRSEAEQYEILVGETNREESSTLRAKIKGDGYAIGLVNEKIVIVGTCKALTMMALDAFLNNHLTDAASAKEFVVAKKNVVSKVEMVDVDASYAIVYAKNLDDAEGNLYNNTTNVTLQGNPDSLDFPVVAAYSLRSSFAGVVGKPAKELTVSRDDVLNLSSSISVGLTSEEVAKAYFSTLGADGYGVRVMQNKVSVCGTNDASLNAAVLLFGTLAKDHLAENDAGEKVVRLPADFTMTSLRNTDWFVDFPKPEGEGILLSGTMDAEDRSVEYYYTGSGIGKESYLAYCEKLKADGYRVYMENEIEGSIFTTFVHDNKKVTLHVSYCAYAHRNSDVRIVEPCFRIISSYLDHVNLVDEESLNPNQTYEKVTESKITSMRLAYPMTNAETVHGNAYIFTLEDGSMVVCDGGVTSLTDTNRLYNLLRDLHTEAFGEPPSASKPITIAAWYLSHGHGDHYGNFYELCKNFGAHIVVERLITNFSSNEQNFNSYNPDNSIRNNMAQIQKLTKNGMKYIKVHTGQKFYLRNLEIEVLYTHEDAYPNEITYFNDTSVVLRTSFHTTDGNGNRLSSKPTTAIWLGDAYQIASQTMRAMYGNTLKSDMVQLAHHGWQGCEWALYQLIQPTCVWWPSSYEFFRETTKSSSVSGAYKVDYNVANLLKSVKYIIIMDGYNTTVTITKDGADYRLQSESETGLYNAGLNEQGYKENEANPIIKYGGCIIKK